ncbi:MAG: ATP-binding cassette domain-containing protein [Deltaproteobacteria bacterium]|nr:ATP-binding cassette domain-containing protein [Candidatus Zymogenaceae bacterium]
MERDDTLPFIHAHNIGIKYFIGNRREDLKSLFTQGLLRREKRKEFWALKNVSFQLNQGTVLGVIGANGAGKTTLCRVLSEILKPDEGEITVQGHISTLLSTGVGFNNALSGRENIYLNCLMLGFTKKQAKDVASEIIEETQLGDFIDQPIKKYSSGMRARLGFNIASIVQPDILVLDEILSAGDYKFSSMAQKKIEELIKKTKIVVISSHRLDLIRSIATEAMWLHRGRIKASGEPDYVTDEYKEFLDTIRKRKPQFKKTKSVVSTDEALCVENLGVKFYLRRNRGYKNQNKRFALKGRNVNEFWALKSINMAVKKGEILGIIGRNGAGKTTLCRSLNEIIKPDEGSISVNGKTSALLGFGTGFNLQLSGKDNIFINGLLMGIPLKKLKNLYQDIIDFSELGAFIDRPMKQYSSGMRARLGFSIATMIQPNILIVDEALSAGDAAFQEKASEKIQELICQSDAVVVVSHNLNFISQLCTRVLWLDRGKILGHGLPKKVVKDYVDNRIG